MKTGIIGLPQVGKTSLFGILTKARLSEQAYANPREAHIGIAKVPDNRLDRLATLYDPKKLTHASVEYVDVGAIGQDALKETANAGLTLYEQMGMSNKANRVSGGGMEQLGQGPSSMDLQTKQFDRLEQFAKLQAPPPIKFKDLEEIVNTKLITNLMPFDVRSDFVKVTGDTVLVPITIQMKYRDITFANKDGVQRGTVNIFGRVSTLTGRVVQTFEDTAQVDVPAELLPRTAENSSVCWKALPLRPGRYKVEIAIKDVNGDRKGLWSRGIVVPIISPTMFMLSLRSAVYRLGLLRHVSPQRLSRSPSTGKGCRRWHGVSARRWDRAHSPRAPWPQ